MPHWPYPFWIAHRGAGKLAPENTLAALRLGAQYGYRMFEFDAKLSADGIPFLMHDATLTRTTNAVQALGEAASPTGGDHPWSVLSRLDAGTWHSRAYAGEPLPTLENIARQCRANGYLLDLEIKPTPGQEHVTGEAVALAVQDLWRGDAVPPLLTSFKPEALAAAQGAAPSLPRGLLLETWTEGWLALARRLGCVAVICNYSLWDHETVGQVHGAGIKALSYTVNDESVAAHLIELGTDGIVTDAVDRFPPAGR